VQPLLALGHRQFILRQREVVEADVAQAAIARRVVRFFDDHDLLLCPVAITPAFDAKLAQLDEFGGVRFGFYYQWMMMTYAITVTACPSLAVPCGLTAGEWGTQEVPGRIAAIERRSGTPRARQLTPQAKRE
jgi:Asp-tRNA(Asn)/Glu-tRNA(Gln) amidotransferase A subunit family amidase